MGAPVGNNNSGKNKVWRDAIRKAAAQYENKELGVKRGQAAFKAAWNLVEAAIKGEEFAIREFGNRLDGKAAQVQEIEVDINARFVIEAYRARLPNDASVRDMLTAAGANHLLPVLEQLRLEKPEVIEHGPA